MAQLSPLLKQATPVVVDHGEGVYLYDVDGKRHLDFTAGIGVTSTGHCHPHVVRAAQEQIGKLVHGQYTTVMHKPLLELTKRLGDVLPSGLDSLFFANSGSEAVEAALRLSRQATKRPNVIVMQGGFHGRTVAAASMTTSGTRFSAGHRPADGRRARRAVPVRLPLRLGRADRDEVRAARAGLPVPDGQRAERDRRDLRRAGARRGRVRPGEHRVHGRPARARRPARHPARHRRDPDRLRPHRQVLGTRPLRRLAPTSCSSRRAWPAASRCPASPLRRS